jgi:hypothetical protein
MSDALSDVTTSVHCPPSIKKLMLQLPQLLVDLGVVHGALLLYLLAHHANHEADGAYGRAMC